MFAVIKSGGRQFKVAVGEKLEVNRLPYESGKQIELGEVLLISDADNTMIGAPLVEGAKVLATVTEHKRGKKVIIFKYKSKKRYRHRRGFRQDLTVLSIDDIIANGKSLVSGSEAAAPQTEEPVAEVRTEEAPVATEEKNVEETPDTGAAKKPRRRRSAKKVEESSTEE
ncbi:large subunit ribosomal protein L21 [Thermosporothrix hazakensis]|jgi:large subunit ribosomal protein L21|uniref:Large ribosomal subunit protein bL21 n=2 Tax=Thermosporothrix TaxID=768650 RepID=A0A326U271_THEHA|nr:50S ribosomal protein L21 [Thermosporothrix hazakensis]PZW24640.1 large subunit ribosomal protein L21 [Thermosporothrix hazakensis]BBH90375.1 hypothetical protein KTC_51260 [Thermosporothrix sp. COM3]GCE48411.1 hypothetical protein KTH_32800 [Thermosporothrix hazakensis]